MEAGECELTRGIFPNPGSMEAGECELTRGTCFTARRLELVAVAGRLWISWCVLGGADYFVFFFLSIFLFSFERTRPAASMRPPLASFTSTSNDNEAGRKKSLFIPGCVQGVII